MDINNILKRVAKENGVSVAEVRMEMQKALDAAYENPDTKAEWDKRFGVGVKPTIEEFILKIAKEVK